MADNFVVNVEGAVYRSDQWLMITRSEEEAHAAGLLSMVGGTIDHADPNDSTIELALRREFREEVGVEIDDYLHYVESKTFISDAGRHVLDIVMLGEYRSGEPTAIDPAEVAEVKWMTTEEIVSSSLTPPWIAQSIRKAHGLRAKLNQQ